MNTLGFYLEQVTDYRRKQGQRISLSHFLSMVILGNLSGYHSLQSLARFFENNEIYFSECFGLLHGVPGYTQTRTILQNIDFESLNNAFYNWASQFIDGKEQWFSFDGKGLNSTTSNYNNEY